MARDEKQHPDDSEDDVDDTEDTEVDGSIISFSDSDDTDEETDPSYPECDCRDDFVELMEYFMDADVRRRFFKRIKYYSTHKPAQMKIIAKKPLKLARSIVYGKLYY